MIRLIINFGFVILFPVVINACSCGSFAGPKEAMADATAVFQGTVVKRVPLLMRYEDFYVPIERYTFAVERIWKGTRDKEIVVYEGAGNCSNFFSTGVSYLVYAIPHGILKNQLYSHKCGPTKESVYANTDVTEIGPGELIGSPISSVQTDLFNSIICDIGLYLLSGFAQIHYLLNHPERLSPMHKFIFAITIITILFVVLLAIRAVRQNRSRLILSYFSLVLTLVMVLFYVTGRGVVRNNP